VGTDLTAPRRSVARAALAALVLVVAAPPAATPARGASGTQDGPLEVAGTSLVVDGEPVWLTGVNVPQAASRFEVGPGCGNPVEPDAVFSSVPPGSLVRVWFTEWMAPLTADGVRDWRGFDRVVEAAEASPDHPRLIVTLGNQSGVCDGGSWRDRAFYRSGWRDGYQTFVRDVVGRYGDSPAVAIWEPVNEPEAADCPDVALGDGCYALKSCADDAAMVLRGFFDDLGALIHRLDPGSLVATGALGGSQCGWADVPSPANASPEVDVLSFHDYGRESEPLPAELAARIEEAEVLGKPLIVEELGILGRDGQACRDTTSRALLVRAKAQAAFAAGASGVLAWSYGGAGPAVCDTYLLDGDPVYAVLAKASAWVPRRTAPRGPDPAWWALAPSGEVVAIGAARDHGDARTVLAARDLGAVDLAPTPSGAGYWILDDAGGVHPRGDAVGRGGFRPGALAAGERAVAMAATATGDGYWIVSDLGRVEAFGDATPYGWRLLPAGASPVVDVAATTGGDGYWLLTADGAVTAWGRATSSPSPEPAAGGAPAVAIVADPDGAGWWVLHADGAVVADRAARRLDLRTAAVPGGLVGIAPQGEGYLAVSAAGRVFDVSGSDRSGPLATGAPAGAVAVVDVPS
jgi:mannan endo-1,4-beta-mannosidase